MAEAPDSWSGAFLWFWRLHCQVCSGPFASLLYRDGTAGRTGASLEWDTNKDIGEFVHFVGGQRGQVQVLVDQYPVLG